MTLQRIEKVTVENWRNWQEPDPVGELGSGVIVLSGPNAIGKSGLWEAIVRGLLDRHWGAYTDSLRPVGTKRVIPRVEIEFRAGGERYRIEKNFGGQGQRDRASFWRDEGGDWKLVDQGEEAYVRCREAVLGREDETPIRGGLDKAIQDTLMQVLLPSQGSLVGETPTPDAVAMTVTDHTAAAEATRLGRVLERVTQETNAVWVGSRERPKKNTDLQVGEARLAAIDEAIEPLEEAAARIDGWVKALVVAEEELAGLGDASSRVNEAEGLRADAKAHRAKREAAHDAHEAARKRAEEAEAARDRRSTLVEGLQAAKEAWTAATAAAGQAAEFAKLAETSLQKATAERDEKTADVARYRAWIEYTTRGDALGDLQRELAAATERLARIEESETILKEIAEERARLALPDDAAEEELDRLEQTRLAAEARLDAGAWSVTGTVPTGIELAVDGERVSLAEVDAQASREVAFAAASGEEVRVAAPLEDARAAEDARRALAEALAPYDAESLKALRERVMYVTGKLDPRAATAEQRKEDALDGATKNDLVKEQGRLEGEVERTESLAAPTCARPEEAPGTWQAYVDVLEKARLQAQADVDAASEAHGAAREKAEAHARQATEAEAKVGEARAQLDGHREAAGPDEALAHAALEAGVARDTAHAVWQKLDAEKEMAEDAKESRAENLSEGVTEAVERLTQVKNLETRIETAREEDPERQLAALSAERSGLTVEVDRARTHAEALLLLEQELEAERDRLTAAVGGPIQKRIDRLLAYLVGDEVEVEVDAEGVPVAVRTASGQEVPYEDQSFGTREQIAVLYRLAVADLVAEERGSGVCLMLDDPFGHTDRTRRQRMLEILTAEADRRGHQILVFTCRPEDFEGTGKHVALASGTSPSSQGR